MAYRKTVRKSSGKKKAGRSARRMSRKTGRKVNPSRRVRRGGLRIPNPLCLAAAIDTDNRPHIVLLSDY